MVRRIRVALRSVTSAGQHPHSLIESEHQIHILNRDTAGAFDEVVDRGEDDKLIAVEADSDIAEVGKCNVFRRGDMIDDSDEWLTCVELAEDFK